MERVFRTCSSAIAGDHVSLILKLTGSTCNLDCAYCFEKRRDYPIHRTISAENVGQAIKHLAEYRLSIELHGGEPLLIGPSKMAQLLEVISETRPDASIRLQTNATLLDDEWCRLFKRHSRLSIGVSFDGFGRSNEWRYFNSGERSEESVLTGIEALIRHDQAFGLICVVNKSNIDSSSEYLDWASSLTGMKVVRFLPCFDTGAKLSPTVPRNSLTQDHYSGLIAEAKWSISFSDYTSFIKSAYSYWKGKRYFRAFGLDPAAEFLKKLTLGKCSTCHMEKSKCNHTITMYPDRTFSTCDELEGSRRYPMSPIGDGTNPFRNILEGRREVFSRDLLSACVDCSVREVCNGGCPAIRTRYSQNDPRGYCKMQKELISFFSTP